MVRKFYSVFLAVFLLLPTLVFAQHAMLKGRVTDGKTGEEIFPDADIANTKYGNNLFYASVDAFNDNTVTPAVPVNIRANFFPNDGVGKAQASDLISTAIGNNDPMFKTFDTTVVGSATGQASANDYHLQSGSPAIGKGNPTYNADMGAYTSDGKGNKH